MGYEKFMILLIPYNLTVALNEKIGEPTSFTIYSYRMEEHQGKPTLSCVSCPANIPSHLKKDEKLAFLQKMIDIGSLYESTLLMQDDVPDEILELVQTKNSYYSEMLMSLSIAEDGNCFSRSK